MVAAGRTPSIRSGWSGEHPIPGTAWPTASPATTAAAVASAATARTGRRLPHGGRIAVRAQPAANRHRAWRSGSWAGSAVMAAPQSARSAGSVATAVASSRAGASMVARRAPVRAHQARHGIRAANGPGVASTAQLTTSTSQPPGGWGGPPVANPSAASRTNTASTTADTTQDRVDRAGLEVELPAQRGRRAGPGSVPGPHRPGISVRASTCASRRRGCWR
jgi:hypothetical protein